MTVRRQPQSHSQQSRRTKVLTSRLPPPTSPTPLTLRRTGNEALELFRAAAGLVPTEPKYSEAASSMVDGIKSFNQKNAQREAQQARERLKQLEEEEDAAWEEDEKEAGFSEIR